MRTIETSITINASAAQIWQVLMDFDQYRQWNPFIKSIQGKAENGASLNVVLQPEGMKPMTMKPRVITLQPHQEFAWLGSLGVKGLFDGEHRFKLVPQGDKTLLVHAENFRGILVPLVLALIGDKTRQGFEAMNKALKERVEA